MQQRTLGRSGIAVGAIGMGCWAIGGPWWSVDAGGRSVSAGWAEVDDAQSIRTVQAALDAGVTLFDTAANYGAGHSERVLGKALGTRRGEAVVATKFGYMVDEATREVRSDHSRVVESVRADCEASLRRLGTDYIDLFQLHVDDFDPVAAPDLIVELEGLVSSGLIRGYGWSTDRVESARVLAQGPGATVVQFAFGLLYERSAMRELLAEEDLGGVARSPLGMGILTGKLSPDSVFPADDVRSQMDFGSGRHRMLVEWADRVLGTLTADGHTAAQGALAWILNTDPGVVPIPGARTEAQAVENAGAAGLGRLSEEQMVRLEGFRAAGIEAVRAYYRSEPDVSETDGWPLR